MSEPQCKECHCRTGGGEFCYNHAPYMVYPKADGSFISDRCGRHHIWLDDLALKPADTGAQDWHPIAEELLKGLKSLQSVHFANNCDIPECGCISSQLSAECEAAIAKAESALLSDGVRQGRATTSEL